MMYILSSDLASKVGGLPYQEQRDRVEGRIAERFPGVAASVRRGIGEDRALSAFVEQLVCVCVCVCGRNLSRIFREIGFPKMFDSPTSPDQQVPSEQWFRVLPCQMHNQPGYTRCDSPP